MAKKLAVGQDVGVKNQTWPHGCRNLTVLCVNRNTVKSSFRAVEVQAGTPAFRGLRQEDHEFEASRDYAARPYLNSLDDPQASWFTHGSNHAFLHRALGYIFPGSHPRDQMYTDWLLKVMYLLVSQ